MMEINAMLDLREEIKTELLAQNGMYNPIDRDTNVRIVEDIRKAITDYADGIMPSAKHIAEVTIATNDNLQIRDFLLGVQLEKDPEFVVSYLELFSNVVEKEKVIPIATVFCGYVYMLSGKDTADEYLNQVLSVNPEYALAKLIKKVANAGMLPSMFKDMAIELHQNVVNNIYEIDNGDSNDN